MLNTFFIDWVVGCLVIITNRADGLRRAPRKGHGLSRDLNPVDLCHAFLDRVRTRVLLFIQSNCAHIVPANPEMLPYYSTPDELTIRSYRALRLKKSTTLAMLYLGGKHK
jgi:hypothetical protein